MANVDATIEKNESNQDSDDMDVVQNVFRVTVHYIRVFLEIIFYPLIWIGKEFVRMWRFLGGGKKNRDKKKYYRIRSFNLVHLRSDTGIHDVIHPTGE